MENVKLPEKFEKMLPNESNLRSDSSQYNEGTKIKQLIHEEYNTAYNHHVLIEAFKSGRARDIADEKVEGDQNAFIIGSGPSLDDAIPYLKKCKGGIFCTTSHASTLFYHGIEPDYIVALDPFCTWGEIGGGLIDWSKTKTKLILHPGVYPDLVENWPNDFILYVQSQSRADSFYTGTQKRMYSRREEKDGNIRDCIFYFYIRTEIMIFACSPAMQMFTAEKIGYKRSFLVGVDFGYHSGKSRFTGYEPKANIDGVITWKKQEHPFSPSEDDVVANNGLITGKIHLYYKKNLISAWRLSRQTLYTTDKGIITEIPFYPLKKVALNKPDKIPLQTPEQIIYKSERYLAAVEAYILYIDNGIIFIESAESLEPLEKYMDELNRQYKCSVCGKVILVDKVIDTEPKCPICNHPESKIVKLHKVDIEGNMDRIKKLVKEVKK